VDAVDWRRYALAPALSFLLWLSWLMTELLGEGRSGAFDPGDYQSVPRATTVATASSASVTRIGGYPRADLRASAKTFPVPFQDDYRGSSVGCPHID
jgi:hypothetical protein